MPQSSPKMNRIFGLVGAAALTGAAIRTERARQIEARASRFAFIGAYPLVKKPGGSARFGARAVPPGSVSFRFLSASGGPGTAAKRWSPPVRRGYREAHASRSPGKDTLRQRDDFHVALGEHKHVGVADFVELLNVLQALDGLVGKAGTSAIFDRFGQCRLFFDRVGADLHHATGRI